MMANPAKANGSACNDGDACTTPDTCDGSGTCTGGSLCGNNTVDGACGEQCDGTDDGACPNHCLSDCSCAPEPNCAGDPTRTIFLGGPETSACHDFDGNQTLSVFGFDIGHVDTACFNIGGRIRI